MLDKRILRKLESLTELPTIPAVISQVLNALDNPNLSASQLASLIEKDQSLTARVLRVANSPFYGFARRISTIDLAVVVLGINSLKEIVMSLIVQRFFSKVSVRLFDVKSFWQYSIFCGSSSRLLARKLGYKLAGEAFVAGLMHDIGILVLVEHFRKNFSDIRKLQEIKRISFVEAETLVLGCTHSDIGAWIAERWNLPPRLVESIRNHHVNYSEFLSEDSVVSNEVNFDEIAQPLTAIVSLAEWFAAELSYKEWDKKRKKPELYLSDEVFADISEDDFLNPESAFAILKQELVDEFSKASVFNDLQARAV